MMILFIALQSNKGHVCLSLLDALTANRAEGKALQERGLYQVNMHRGTGQDRSYEEDCRAVNQTVS
jgi:hypothetical protein